MGKGMPSKNSDSDKLIPMQYLIIEAVQDPSCVHEREYGGASVGCWIKGRSENEAALLAKAWVQNSGWVPLSIEEQYSVTEDFYSEDAGGREYFEQALIDNEVFVFYTFPKDAKA